MTYAGVTPQIWNSITMINSSVNIKNNLKNRVSNLRLQDKVKEKVIKQATLRRGKISLDVRKWDLDEGYDRCVVLAAKDLTSVITNQPFESNLNSGLSSLIKALLLSLTEQEHLKAVAALAVWCRRTDELVDGSNRSNTEMKTLELWEQRLIDTFEGRPRDIYDAALYDTITKYQIDIQLFKDLIEGMRLDLNKPTYESFDELYLYSYYATGAPVLMCIQVIGFDPQSKASLETLYDSIVSFAVALQLTDILRDIYEDAKMGRIYLPQDELQSAGISSEDIITGRVNYSWRKFMKTQIERTKMLFNKSDLFIMELKPEERWFFWWLSSMYKELLDNIEANDYNFTKETYVGITKQLETLVLAHGKTLAQQIFKFA